MHDTDHSGWWLLAPFVNIFFLLSNGTVGTNRFGEDPKLSGQEVSNLPVLQDI
jgi:uncharacterized membrane protein YhaH (DUF805 family)